MSLGLREKTDTIENTIERLESIISCKIIEGEYGEFSEIHVVSNKQRAAKQLVRDIQSLLIATYGIQIDHKMISIAEIPGEDIKKKQTRIKILSVSHDSTGDRANIKIVLGKDDEVFENSAKGINAVRNIDRMLVDTTLKTVEEACGYQETFVLEDIKTVNFTTAQAIVVIIGVYNGIEQRFSGTSLIGQDYKKSVVKATLDAINRYLIK
jgi:hypothetical protein